ncbi:hypothetical protein JMJ35_008620 [Cladonia borealis]|uniref:COX assembly mitochondrial protein n=1 Tax=Cladonia borealis TaxID=184061 RepID=A0AA39V2Y7_9LECA|nr:hypothetical protein JMJ35_008620 [Cladonia borealis]
MMATPRPGASPVPSRNPIPLSASQEAAVTELYHKRVRNLCADEIREFAACASGRTFSVSWACRPQRLAMNGCMMTHATQKEQDAAREEWFATMDERRRKREEEERKKQEVKRLHREWWERDKDGQN